MKTILKVLVGSRAYGVYEENSDYDYRGIFIAPTRELLSLKNVHKKAIWTLEDGKDTTMYEIGHFLFLATKCNPTILEVFKAPVVEITQEGKVLRGLFADVWNTISVYNAFKGYSHNQRTKFLDNKDNRANKYAIAYTRTLWQLLDLLYLGDYSVELKSQYQRDIIKKYRANLYTVGEVINYAENMIKNIYLFFIGDSDESQTNKLTNYDKINKFLLKIRKKFW